MTGDHWFPGGVGDTEETGAFEQLLGDVTTRVFGDYGDDTVVYPEHRTTQSDHGLTQDRPRNWPSPRLWRAI